MGGDEEEVVEVPNFAHCLPLTHMHSPPQHTNEPRSLLQLCIAKLNRRFDQVYTLNTALGDVPSHLLKQILPKTLNYTQLERLIEYNPHMEDELVQDLDPYYRTATLREFALLRKEVEKPDFQEPDSWRLFHAKMKQERDEKLMRVKAGINKSYKVMDEEKEKNSTKRLQHFIAPPAKSKGWGSSSSYTSRSSNPMSRAINSVKKEIQTSRTPKFESYQSKQISSARTGNPAAVSRPAPPKPKPNPALKPSITAKFPAVRNNVRALPSAIVAQKQAVATKPFSLALPK
ncbi:UNVERIFIED_CONTAM: hypothetical protein HDU68_011908 [Siphonaria sp. JEL0065]|nr:hypothetical protein HDU68_011908 [Siphonaria sp. JEL0065]